MPASLAALALAGAIAAPSSSTPRMHLSVHLIQRCKPVARCLPLRIVTRMKSEIERIWSRLDVQIAWVDSIDAERPVRSAGMTVLLEENADAPWPLEQGFALAAVHQPENPCGWALAHVWVRRIQRHVASVRVAGRPFATLPDALADTILGRALARALAHEIGHYLLGTAKHSPHGLMRAEIVPRELLEETIQSLYGLSSRERESLKSCGADRQDDLTGTR
jgi:hypothetical protein